MTNRKTTRRALVLSLLSLLLCCSMLVGTTFAWFTDSVQSGNNKIIAGNLDVELTHTNAFVSDESVAGKTNLFVDEKGEKILWEPGVVVWENLTVSNLGTLALKYQLSVNFKDQNAVEGTGAKLSEALQVAVVDPIDPSADRETVLKAVTGKGTDLVSFVKEGKLLPKDSTLTVDDADDVAKTYGIVIWWEPSSEDNKWNLQNGVKSTDGNPLQIDLGINLLATQLEAEDDSFGTDYDKNTVYVDVTVTNAAELEAAIAAGKKTIGIMGKIQLTKGLFAKDVTLVGASSDAAIDFATHNIQGTGEGTITYRNLKLTTQALGDSAGERAGWHGGIDYCRHAVSNYEGCEISGVFTTYSETVNISDCTFLPYIQDGEEYYHIFVYGSKTVNVEGSTFFYADRAIKVFTEGAAEAVVNVTDCVFKADETFTAVNKALINVDATYMKSVELNVNNIVVDEKLKSAAVYSGDANKVTATIDGVVTSAKVASQTELNEALATDGEVAVELAAGTYKLSNISSDEVTITGTGDDTVIDFTGVANVNGASITFENMKFQGTNANVMDGFGIQGTTGHIAYKNCTFDGAVTNEYYGSVSYEKCTFTGIGYITTYAVNSATFKGCVFDKADSRAVLVYCHGDIPCVVKIDNCQFKAAAKATTWSGDWTAAIEVDTTNTPTLGTSVTVNGCTYDANYSGLVRDKSAAGKANAVITIDGVQQ